MKLTGPVTMPFRRYIPDISATEREKILEGVRSAKKRLVEEMERLGLSPYAGAIPASRAIRADLATIKITLEELKRKDWVDLGCAPEAEGDLRVTFSGLQGIITEITGHDMSQWDSKDPGNEEDKRGGRHNLPERGEDSG